MRFNIVQVSEDDAYSVRWTHVNGRVRTAHNLSFAAALTMFAKKDDDTMIDVVELIADKTRRDEEA